MTDPRRRAAAFASEIASAYPSAINAETLRAWAVALADVGLDIADDISALLRVRSTFPPSVAQIYEAAREVRQETMSERKFDSALCVFADGVTCFNCDRNGIVHGHLIDAGEVLHGTYHLGRHLDGIADELERAKHPERCDCGFDVPANVDVEKVIGLTAKALFK